MPKNKKMTPVEFVADLGEGTMLNRFYEEVEKVAQRCLETKGSGRVNLGVRIGIREGKVYFEPAVSPTYPKRTGFISSAFGITSEEGQFELHKKDPDQPDLVGFEEAEAQAQVESV